MTQVEEIQKKRTEEKETLQQMLQIYCHGQHKTKKGNCVITARNSLPMLLNAQIIALIWLKKLSAPLALHHAMLLKSKSKFAKS